MTNPGLWPAYLLAVVFIAALILVLNEKHDEPHAGEEEQPTHCVPDEVIRMENDEL